MKKIFIFLLTLVVVILCFQNYRSGTYLSGWDTLHPEFNFALYFKRIFFGVWQEHQGLGALAAQAHVSEIPRMVIYYLLSLLFPDNFLRYGYFFLTLIGGTLGMYFFLSGTCFKKAKDNIRSLASFAGGLFYLLNIGTLQQYYLPFEMFATHFAFLPWLFLLVAKIVHEGGRKNYLIFVLVTFFNAPIAHTPTLFYAYFLGLLIFLFGYFLHKRNLWKKGLVVLGLTVVVNSFWLLPHLYFVFTSGNIVQNSKISSMFSQTAFSTGQKFGDLKNTLFLKNYLFEWGKYDNDTDRFVRLFGEWNRHLARVEITAIQYLLAGMVLVGLFWSVKRKDGCGLAVLGIFSISFLLIANNVPVIKDIYNYFQTNLPLFKEALRFPYTKFSILLIFAQAVFFGVFWEKTAEKVIQDLKQFKAGEITFDLTVVITALLIYFMWPAFKGNLINKDMKVSFPAEYFSAMGYLNNQANQRIALLPMPQIWGWIYHDWGYEGAGFEWFGLQNPLLDREFDRWNPYNEQFYWEASYALYSQNNRLFENVLEKYQVGWLMVDESTLNPSSPKALFLEEIEEIMSGFELAVTFGKIKIYKVNLETQVKDFVYLAENLPVINGYEWGNYDRGYEEVGDYLSNPEVDIFYPFRSLFTGRKIGELDIKIEDQGDKIIFKAQLPEGLEDYLIQLPLDYEGKELVEIDPVTYDTKYYIPTIDSDGKTLSVSFPKITGLLSAEIDPSKQNLQAINCNQFSQGQVGLKNKQGLVELQAKDASNCGASFYLPSLSHKYAYLISAEAKIVSGKSLLFWLENLTNRKADMEVYLDTTTYNLTPNSYLIQPPMADDGLGYTLHFDNISIGRQATINELGKISVLPIPYRFLTEIKLTANSLRLTANSYQLFQVRHSNPSVYKVFLKESPCQSKETPCGNITLVLSQAFHKGWLAFDLGQKKILKDHVKINNWSNGWRLPANSYNLTPNSYILVFWPQYLEYAGFVLMIACFIYVIARKSRA